MKDEDIKKIFSVAWVKERKIFLGSVVVVAVLSLFIWIATLPSAYEQCVEKEIEAQKRCDANPHPLISCWEDANIMKKMCKKKHVP